MNEIEELRTFVHLVDAGSSTKAAARRGVAVSAISRRMKDLETRLGVQLIQRTTRQMHLTDAGRTFYERCTRLLADLEEAEAEVTQNSADLSGTLKIASPLSFGIAHLTPALTEFMQQHPEIDVELDMNDRRVDIIAEGFDIAIRIGKLADSSLMARRIAEFRQIVGAAPEFFDKHGRPSTPEDLEGLPALCYANLQNPDIWSFEDPSGTAGRVQVKPRLLSSNGDSIREAAIAGLGVICQPSFIVYEALADGRIEAVLREYRWFDMGIYAVYPPTRYLSTRVRRFIDFLAARFGPNPYWDDVLKD